MKHRWLAALLLIALALAACSPDEGRAAPASETPAPADFYDDY